MSLDNIENWFQIAVPSPTPDNLKVQLGVHLEEVGEMLECIELDSDEDLQFDLAVAKITLAKLSVRLKSRAATVSILNRKEFLDSLADQIVTAAGCGHMAGMNVPEAALRVNLSNWSKFDGGKPIFNENGKIVKGPGYTKPNLEGLY